MPNRPKSLPIACSLTPDENQDRGSEWSLLLSRLISRDTIPGGLRLTVDPSAADCLERLVDLERACCPWINFEFVARGTVEMTAAAPGDQVLAGWFQAPGAAS